MLSMHISSRGMIISNGKKAAWFRLSVNCHASKTINGNACFQAESKFFFVFCNIRDNIKYLHEETPFYYTLKHVSDSIALREKAIINRNFRKLLFVPKHCAKYLF